MNGMPMMDNNRVVSKMETDRGKETETIITVKLMECVLMECCHSILQSRAFHRRHDRHDYLQ